MARTRQQPDPSAPDAGDFGGPEPEATIDPTTLAGGSGGDSGGGSGGPGGDDRTFDPAIHVGVDKRNRDGTFRRKRVSGGGSGQRRARGSTVQLSLGAVSSALLTIHGAAAAILATPELALSPQESEPLASAIIEVEKLYPTTVDPRIVAWGNLMMVAAMIYAPRLMAIRMRQNAERQKRPAPSPQAQPPGSPVTGDLTTLPNGMANGAFDDGFVPSQN